MHYVQKDPSNEHHARKNATMMVSQKKQYNADALYDMNVIYEGLFDEMIHMP